MCTMVFAWDAHPRYRFVFAGNRDEFHARGAAPADWWRDPVMLAGRDLQAGGTWLGLSADGHFAVVSNFREGHARAAGKRSRGELVTGYLAADDTHLYREHLDASADLYSGYNLIYGDLTAAMYYFSNRGRAGGLGSDVHGLSNHLLDTPWPKVARAVDELAGLLDAPVIETGDLVSMLGNRDAAADAELPDTGVGIELERLLSAIFIVSPQYGTRSSTAILLDRNGLLQFVERRFEPDGSTAGESRYEFRLG